MTETPETLLGAFVLVVGTAVYIVRDLYARLKACEEKHAACDGRIAALEARSRTRKRAARPRKAP